jgi:hypothetical protein
MRAAGEATHKTWPTSPEVALGETTARCSALALSFGACPGPATGAVICVTAVSEEGFALKVKVMARTHSGGTRN